MPVRLDHFLIKHPGDQHTPQGPSGWAGGALPTGADVLAYFDIGASNGPVEAINGRLEHLRGIALELRNRNHYILRSLIHSGHLHNRINAL